MKKLFCVILILLLAAVCACALAEEAPPTLQFAEEERINFKPIITGNRPELAVDTWLQQMAVLDEDYFWSVDPDGPKYSFKHVDGPVVKAHIDKENVLRMDTILKKPCRVTFELTVKWAGQTAKTNMYIEFFTCKMPKTIGFEDEYTIYTGELVRLEANYDGGKWPYRDWRGVYPVDEPGSSKIDVWTETFDGGAFTMVRGAKAGKASVKIEANQNGLNWYKTVKFKVVDFADAQGNKYLLDPASKTAVLTKGAKKAASVTVPDKIKVGKTKYKVTGIGKGAFSGNKKMTSLTIGKNISDIGAKAFSNCKKLEKITVRTKNLKAGSIGAGAFKNISKKAVFKCPSKALAKAYKKLFISAGAPKKITCK